MSRKVIFIHDRGKIILIQDRHDNYHLVDFCAPSGRKYTLCEEVYAKKTIINTLALDDVFDGVCTKCKEVYEQEFSNPLADHRVSKGSLQESLIRGREEARARSSEREEGYLDRASRVWDKLSRYKRKLKLDIRK